jgi:hypothetical protein
MTFFFLPPSFFSHIHSKKEKPPWGDHGGGSVDGGEREIRINLFLNDFGG